MEAPGQLPSLPTFKSGLASTAAHDSATTVSTHTHTHTHHRPVLQLSTTDSMILFSFRKKHVPKIYS